MSFAEKLEKLLKERKISKTKMLSDLKLGKNQFNYWKNNNSIPNGFTVQAIAAYLNISVADLIGDYDIFVKNENGTFLIEAMPTKQKPSVTDEELKRLSKLTDGLSDENFEKLLDYAKLLLKSQE